MPHLHIKSTEPVSCHPWMTTVANQKRITLVPLWNAQKQICHYILNKITFTCYLPNKMSASWDARCEDESGNSAGMLWRVGKHRGINEQTGNWAKREKNISSDRWHTFSALFLHKTNDKTPCKLCRIEESNLTLFMSVVSQLINVLHSDVQSM